MAARAASRISREQGGYRRDVERRLLRRHVAEAKVWPRARAAERRMRRDAGDFELAEGGRRNPAKAHIRLWKRLRSGLRVWIVKGRLERNWFDLDLTAGGHDLVYRKYVPRPEVWIDDDVAVGERPYVVVHELREHALMAKGHRYNSAHDSANRFESACRRALVDLEEALEAVGSY